MLDNASSKWSQDSASITGSRMRWMPWILPPRVWASRIFLVTRRASLLAGCIIQLSWLLSECAGDTADFSQAGTENRLGPYRPHPGQDRGSGSLDACLHNSVDCTTL